jgi:hypothetical protein
MDGLLFEPRISSAQRFHVSLFVQLGFELGFFDFHVHTFCVCSACKPYDQFTTTFIGGVSLLTGFAVADRLFGHPDLSTVDPREEPFKGLKN